MIRTTGVAGWNTYMKTVCSSGQQQNVAIVLLTDIYIYILDIYIYIYILHHFHYSHMTKLI